MKYLIVFIVALVGVVTVAQQKKFPAQHYLTSSGNAFKLAVEQKKFPAEHYLTSGGKREFGWQKLGLVNPVEGKLGDQRKCASSNVYNIVKDALQYYAGTDNAQGIASRITNNVVQQYKGPWITVATQMSGTNLQWSYWGSNAAVNSNEYCLYQNDMWLVQVLEAALS